MHDFDSKWPPVHNSFTYYLYYEGTDCLDDNQSKILQRVRYVATYSARNLIVFLTFFLYLQTAVMTAPRSFIEVRIHRGKFYGFC